MRSRSLKNKSNKKALEDAEQIKFFQWIAWNQIKDPRLKAVYHVPNGGLRNVSEATKLKRMGLRPGVPDIVVPIPIGKFPGLFIEMKVKPNDLDPDQVNFTNLLHSLGYCVRIAWSGEEAIEILKNYLKGT